MAVETLSGMPSTAPLLVRAALTAGLRRGGTVPDRTLVVEGVRVDRGRLAAYQRLTGYAVEDTLPQPYPWVLAFPVQTALMTRLDFPLPLPGMVHLQNRVTTHRRLDAADPLTLSATAGEVRPHRRGRTLDVRLEARVDDQLVWECDSVYLSRGRGDRRRTPQQGAAPAPEGPAVARWRLPEDLGRSYAAVSGDVNPIHLYSLSARVDGLPAPDRARDVDVRPHPRRSGPDLAGAVDQPACGSPGRSSCRARSSSSRSARARTRIAGLRSAKDPDKAHLVLTLDV